MTDYILEIGFDVGNPQTGEFWSLDHAFFVDHGDTWIKQIPDSKGEYHFNLEDTLRIRIFDLAYAPSPGKTSPTVLESATLPFGVHTMQAVSPFDAYPSLPITKPEKTVNVETCHLLGINEGRWCWKWWSNETADGETKLVFSNKGTFRFSATLHIWDGAKKLKFYFDPEMMVGSGTGN